MLFMQIVQVMVDLLKHKQAGKTVVKVQTSQPSNVVNLMDALRSSVAAEKGGAKPSRKAKGKQEDLRRQPQFKFPIEGGKSKQPKAIPSPKAKPKRKSA